MKRSEKIGLSIFCIWFLVQIITLPKSPGTFYEPAHYYNLYLPNFGLGSDLSIQPFAFKTLLSQYSFLKVLLEIFQGDIITLHQFITFLSPFLGFLAFFLFFTFIPDFKDNKLVLSSLVCSGVSWPPIPLLLGMGTIFCLTRSILQANVSLVISWLLLFIGLAFYWHSAHMVFLFPIVFFLLFLIYPKFLGCRASLQENAPRINLNKLLVFLVISIFVWVYIKETPIFSKLLGVTYFLDPLIMAEALFSKGSFIPLDYQYSFNFCMPLRILDALRYATFLLTYLAIIFYSIHTIKIKNHDGNLIWALSLLFGSIVFQALYLISTKTVAPAPVLIFLIPFVLGLCIIKTKHKSNSTGIKLIFGALFVSIIISLVLSQSYMVYKNSTTSMESIEDFDKYYPLSVWLATNMYDKKIISDANTMGYVAIWYGKNKQHYTHPVYFESIGFKSYDLLYKGSYDHAINIIYNFDAYRKNLVFESLEGWNKYKPLSPDVIQKNSLDVLYNDGGILILSKY